MFTFPTEELSVLGVFMTMRSTNLLTYLLIGAISAINASRGFVRIS